MLSLQIITHFHWHIVDFDLLKSFFDMYFVAVILGTIALGALIWFITKKDPGALSGVYSQTGKWFPLKKLVFMLLLVLRKRRQKKAATSETTGPGYGVKSRSKIEAMECIQPLCDDEMAIDSMYFNGIDANGTYVITRIARRHGRKAEIWLTVNVPGIGFFQSPIHPDTNVYNVDPNVYSAGGLKYECLEPMKRWHITFNGPLRKGMSSVWNEEPFETATTAYIIETIQFSLTWCAFTDCFDFDTDIHPSCLASAVCREKWSKEFFERLRASHQTHYEQCGELRGTFVAEGHPRQHLRLRGCHAHSFGVRDWSSFHRYAVNFAYLENGTAFHVNTVSMPNTLSLLQCGYLSMPNAVMHSVNWTDMNLLDLGEDHYPPTHYKFNFKANGVTYHVQIESHTVFRYYLHNDWRSVVFEQVSTCDVNGIKGYGIFEFLYRNPHGSPVKPQLSLHWLQEPNELAEEESSALALKFSQHGCASSPLVGGKGCQLALLTQLKSDEFNVPVGFCLTTHAYNCQVKRCLKLQQALGELNRVSCTNPEDLQSACEVAVCTFKETPLCSEVQNVLVTYLTQVFGDQCDTEPLAVRSSSCGEDGTELSAAGQMETVLGVKGLKQISEAVRFCWASQFAFPAVSYRRGHGQPVRCSSGVVIQRLAPAAVSGVLFTFHPATYDPSIIVINATYGFGESVVLGQSQPDEIIVHRSWDDKLCVEQKVIGNKQTRIVLTPDDGVTSISGACGDENRCCLSDDVILRLAKLGSKLEKHFGNPRDIEFAVGEDDTIYLLQARPVTTVYSETDDEIIHEFDTSLAMDQEILTTANIQEMMPGSVTPLTMSTFFMSLEYAFQNALVETGVHPNIHVASKFISICCNQGFVNMMYINGECEINSIIGDKRIAELAIVGEVLENLSLEELISYNGQFPLWKRIKVGVNCICRLWNISGRAKHKKWTNILDKLTIAGHSHQTATELHTEISDHLSLLKEIWNFHIACSLLSSIWIMVLMNRIAQNKTEWKPTHVSDVAVLLSKCEDVCSADVPLLLQKLADEISDSTLCSQFLHYSPEEAVHWLKSPDSGAIGQAFVNFLKRHGHRCARELELREKSWESEPESIVTVLQMMVGSHQLTAAHGKSKSTTDNLLTVNDIRTPLTAVGRLLVQWILPKVRQAVGAREYSKSLTVKLADVFKQGYRKLARMMVQESYLPDEDLVFFFTHRELGHMLRTRSGRMIMRAQRRRQVLNRQMKLQFPRICRGHPVPLEDNVAELDKKRESTFTLTGLPVGQGEVTSKARVMTSLQAASEIQPGEILIVPYTDVGWSPYFPLISGLVAEIGGIVAHGAVVAREYGLPCVVNVPNATVLFTSGDTVRLNGTDGIVEKL